MTFLLVVSAALGIGMGAEWPVAASLAMESWPARSRGLMANLLQSAFGLGFALASAAYRLLFDVIAWRGLLSLGILPAILCVFIRFCMKEPVVWVENRMRQQEQKQEVRAPLLVIFKPALLRNTMTACAYTAGGLVVYEASDSANEANGRMPGPHFDRADEVTRVDAMATVLDFESLPCAESALHGLRHWHRAYPERVEGLIDGFLATHSDARPKLLTYARSARCGCVL